MSNIEKDIAKKIIIKSKWSKNIANKRKKNIYAIYETKNQLISFLLLNNHKITN